MSYAHELARQYNQDLAARDGRRADEIEWIVDGNGDVRLRNRPEWSRANLKRAEARAEREQQRWAQDHALRTRPFAPVDADLPLETADAG